jgi:hypothetical protein
MDLKAGALRFPIFVFLFIFFFSSACSTPSWFPIKKGPPHKAKMKELIDKEVVLIDREEYVKVSNPKASEGNHQPRTLYIPVDEYLAKRGDFAAPVAGREEPGKEIFSSSKTLPPVSEKEVFLVSSVKSSGPRLKRKVVIAHFDDRTTTPDEMFGDWVADKLVKEVDRKSQRVLLVDYLMIKDFLEKRGTDLKDLETPNVLNLLNEVFGINAIVSGHLSGPYVFVTRTANNQEGTASAIIRIDMKVIDTFSGKPLKQLSANNPVNAAKEKGPFPEEKAKIKAIDLTLSDLGGSLSRELDGLDWSCRIVKVEGDEIYLNAGRQTGLKVGDTLEVFRPGENGARGELKGKIRISAFLGIDASMGKALDAKKPDVRDIVRPAAREGT